MATIRVAIDNCYGYSSDMKTLNAFAEKVRAAGHTVHTHGVGPNQIQGVMRKSSNKCDIAIQIAGGKCLGTMCDFWVGANPNARYYHATKMGIAFYKCWKPEWICHREPRDHFSTRPGPVKVQADKMTGKVMTDALKEMSDRFVYGYGETGEECAKTFLQLLNGGSADANEKQQGQGGGGSVLELIKQCVSDWDAYGVDMDLRGDTLYVKRSNPNGAVAMNEKNILLNSVSFTDYDVGTPNSYGNVKDNYLINRFGQIPLGNELGDSSWQEQFLLMSQRGHGHSIDLKCIINPSYTVGKWVNLSLDAFGIKNRKYMITKSSLDDERTMSLTLEPGPPSRYVEVQEVAEEEATEEETTEEEATE